METMFRDVKAAHGTLARERVIGDLRALTRDSEALLKATASDMSEKAKQTREQLKLAIARAKDVCADLQDRAIVVAKKADKGIRRHPYESIGVAFGLGILLGVLAYRK